VHEAKNKKNTLIIFFNNFFKRIRVLVLMKKIKKMESKPFTALKKSYE
jgi:hypothetical protein